MRITYIVGASGAGKTTFHRTLKEAETGAAAVELDDHQPGPTAGHGEWLTWRAAELLQESADHAGDGTDAHLVVTGIVSPFELIGTYAWLNAMQAGVEVRFVMLDRPWSDVADSLTERLADWDEDDRSEQIENNRRLHRRLRTQVAALGHGHVVEDGDLTAALDLVTAWNVTPA